MAYSYKTSGTGSFICLVTQTQSHHVETDVRNRDLKGLLSLYLWIKTCCELPERSRRSSVRLLHHCGTGARHSCWAGCLYGSGPPSCSWWKNEEPHITWDRVPTVEKSWKMKSGLEKLWKIHKWGEIMEKWWNLTFRRDQIFLVDF